MVLGNWYPVKMYTIYSEQKVGIPFYVSTDKMITTELSDDTRRHYTETVCEYTLLTNFESILKRPHNPIN